MATQTGETTLDELSTSISDEIGILCGHLNVLHGRLVAIAEQALITGAWAGHGIRSPEHWLAWQTGLSPSRAANIVLLAKRRHELPATVAALEHGEMSIDQAVAVARYVRAHNDAEACEIAKRATVGQLTNLLARYRYKPEPTATRDDVTDDAVPTDDTSGSATDVEDDEPAPASDDAPTFAHGITAPTDAELVARAVAAGRVIVGYGEDGRYFLHADLPADEGARVDAALREAKDRLFRAGNAEATWADALVDLAERALAATTPSRQNRYRTYVHLDTEGAWLTNGPALPKALLDKLLCDGQLQPVWTKDGHPVNIGRAAKAIPDHTRRLVLARDGCCRYPGCSSRVGLDVHHIRPWTDGGPTDLSNLGAYCRKHHTRSHRGEFRVSGDAERPDGLVHRRADGTVIEAHHAPAIPGRTPPPAPPAGHVFRHPTGERIDAACVVFSDPPTHGAKRAA